MSHWWWALTGAFAYGAARDLVGWSWRRRKARQDAPWDRALNRNQLR